MGMWEHGNHAFLGAIDLMLVGDSNIKATLSKIHQRSQHGHTGTQQSKQQSKWEVPLAGLLSSTGPYKTAACAHKKHTANLC